MPPALFILVAVVVACLAASPIAACDGWPVAQRGFCRAQNAQYAPDCAEIDRAPARLACWDRLHRLANCPAGDGPVEHRRCAIPVRTPLVKVEQTTSAPSSNWHIQQERSAFTDATNVFLSVASDGPLRCGRRQRASLILRCLDDQTAVFVVHDCATPRIGADGWPTDLRLDGGTVEAFAMTPTRLGDGFGLFDYRDARPLIEQLQRAQTLHMRFSDIEGVSSEMRFSVAGLSGPVGTLKSACGWSDIAPWEKATERASRD